MRELVYLSNNKLRQFVNESPRRRWWPGGGRFALTLPLGSLQLEQSPSTSDRKHAPLDRQLKNVKSHINISARWYEDEELSSGEWIAFDVPLIFALSEPLALFADTCNSRVVRPTRLLLHGSSTSTQPHLWTDVNISDNALPRGMSQASFVYELEKVFRSVNFLAEPQGSMTEAAVDPEGRLKASVFRLIESLDYNFPPVTEAWMSGLARVSAIVSRPEPATFASSDPEASSLPDRVVVASPLYIERVGAPQD